VPVEQIIKKGRKRERREKGKGEKKERKRKEERKEEIYYLHVFNASTYSLTKFARLSRVLSQVQPTLATISSS
jgi:hypothetical protein